MDIKNKNGLFRFLQVDKIIDHLIGYVETKLDLYKIQFKEEIVKAIGALAIIMILVAVFGLMIVFLSLAIANHLNFILDSNFIGFLIVAIIYLIAGILILIYRDILIFDMAYRFFFKDEDEEVIDEDEIND